MAYSPEEKQEILDKVCALLEKGISARQALKEDGMPQSSTFFKWLSEERSFSEQYARACESRADAIFEDILNIADDNSKDTRIAEDGKELTDHDVIQRSRLRVDARKWVLSKMMPKKYGDRLDLTTDGESMNMSPEERKAKIQALLAKANAK